jgi:hypothetical protein
MKLAFAFALALSAALFAGCESIKQHEEPISPSTKPVQSNPATKSAGAAVEIIIDNNDPEFKSVGNWNLANGGRDYKDETVWVDTSDPASATWTPKIPAAGEYAVYEWHGDDPNSDHATDAPFTITHAGGTTTVKVDLTKNTGEWHSLGTFKFNAGTAGNVTLTNKAGGNVIADAVKFVRVK